MIYLKMPDGREYSVIYNESHGEVLAWDEGFKHVYTIEYLIGDVDRG